MLLETAIAGGAVWGYKKVKQKAYRQYFEMIRSFLEEQEGFVPGSFEFVHGYNAKTTNGHIGHDPHAEVILLGKAARDGVAIGYMVEINTTSMDMVGHAELKRFIVQNHKDVFKLAKKNQLSFLNAAVAFQDAVSQEIANGMHQFLSS